MSADAQKPLVLFFGSARAGEYQTLAGMGYEFGLLRDSDCYYARHIPDQAAVLIDVPFSVGIAEICRHIEQIQKTWKIVCLPVVFEGHIELAAQVSRQLGYPALDEQTLLAVRNKTVMRDRLVRELGTHCTGRYESVTSLDDALQFADVVGYPVVLKPAQLYHSLYVTPCSDKDALRGAFRKLMAGVPQHADALRGGSVLLQVEEFLRGSDHSVDVIAQSGITRPTPLVDVIVGATLGASDFHHFARISPSVRHPEEQRELQELAVRACHAVGIRTGAAHVEMIWTDQGPRVVELAARPGGNRHFLLYTGRGIDLIGGYVAALSGGTPVLTPTRNRPVAVVTPYPSTAGRIRRFRHLEAMQGLPSFERLTMRARPGDYIGTPLDGTPAPMVVQLSCADSATLRADIDRLWNLRDEIIELSDGKE